MAVLIIMIRLLRVAGVTENNQPIWSRLISQLIGIVSCAVNAYGRRTVNDWVKSKGWRKKSFVVAPIVALLVYIVLLAPFLPESELDKGWVVAFACMVGWRCSRLMHGCGGGGGNSPAV